MVNFIKKTRNCNSGLPIAILSILVAFSSLVGHSQSSNIAFNHLTILDGLSNNTVLCIYQDSYGYLWFGTRDGLNRYDGYEFNIFRNEPSNNNSLSGNHVGLIYEDNYRNFWVCSESNSLDYYVRETNSFIPAQQFLNDSSLIINGIVRTMLHDGKNNLWIGSSEGLVRYNFENGNVTTFEVDEENIHANRLINGGIYKLVEDGSGNIWIGTYEGLSKFTYKNQLFSHYNVQTHRQQGMTDDYILDIHVLNDSVLLLATNSAGLLGLNVHTNSFAPFVENENTQLTTVQHVIRDSNQLWISGEEGLYTFDMQSGDLHHHLHDDKNPVTISSNNVLNLFKDKSGTIWISHWHDGISYYNVCENKFEHFKKEPCMNSINNNTVRAITKDPDGDLWIATDQGGVNILNSNTGRFEWFTNDTQSDLPSNVCKDILIDAGKNCFVATSRGIVVYRKKYINNTIYLRSITRSYFSAYNNQDFVTRLLSSNVENLYEDYHGNIWIGTTANLFVLSNNEIIMGQISDARYNPIYAVLEDFEGICWVGCLEGFYKYNKRSNTFENQNHRLIPNSDRIRINALKEDSGNNLWIGTNGQGLYILNHQRETIDITNLTNELPSKVVNAFVETETHMWISTNNGIVKVDKNVFSVVAEYNSLDGLQSDQFYRNAAFRDENGYIYMGGVNGFNRFHPDKIVLNDYKPPLYITDLKINNESVTPGHPLFGKVIDSHIELEDYVVLSHQHSLISFEFRGLNFLTPEKNKYAYKLEGFDESDEWNDLGQQRMISYTNLEPGDYKLQIKSANNDGIWNENYTELKIEVLPPWWQTLYFKIMLVGLVLTIIYLLKKWITYNLNLRNAVKVERLEKDKIQEVEEMKIRFFTNISHEFRTPLTLILSPLEKIQQSARLNSGEKLQLSLMKNNAQRLLRLVNQILDIRKIEAGKLRLETRFGDIVGFIKTLVSSFEPMARQKSVKLLFSCISNQIYTLFDEDKIDKIIYNLLSNAFKYTPDGGKIQVSVSVISRMDLQEKNHNKYVEISVEDNGIGIPPEAQQKIFDRFYQYEDPTHKIQGTGIGLALTKDLVELHNGTIRLESSTGNGLNQNRGTRFIIHLPLLTNDGNTDTYPVQDDAVTVPLYQGSGDQPEGKTVILVIEDNSDMRLFIKTNFQDEFTIMEASEGISGFDLAVKHIPDVILCDVMMPGMDGLELTKKIKSDARTSHIPVIFLTARASEEARISGLETGADDYITKPFNIDILRQKVINILNSRKTMQDKFSKQILLEPAHVNLVSHDEKFLNKAIRIVEKHMDDPDFNVEQFSREIGLSKMQLYRKMNALTNQTAKEFIKMIRLKRAAQLLEQEAMNVSEVTYAVGFREISYFRKCFKKYYGVAPSEYKPTKN